MSVRSRRKDCGGDRISRPIVREAVGPSTEDVRRCELRRGAWYPVLSLAPDEAVLEVRLKTVIVPLAYLEVVRTRPKSWTLIPAERYAVCPNCAERVALGRPPERLRCPGCQGLFDVDLNHHQIAPA